ncbi:MAG: hypothetical protein K9N40_04415 [Candidatus Cloacimonetes bacterium]|nr:hypothetical protein [Candidatus Cloacimonadota bacterium]
MKQFLLVCIAVIILVVAIVGITWLIQQDIVHDNREAMITDLNKMAKSALEYFKSPVYIGGGGGKWVPKIDDEYQKARLNLWLTHAGFRQHTTENTFITNNGIYEMWLRSYEDILLNIEGTGIEIGKDNINPVKVLLKIYGPTGGISIEILN